MAVLTTDASLPKKKKRTYARIVALTYLALIFGGALLLMLPVCSREGVVTPFLDCLFTATSATCVTGLVVVDTVTHWSVWGQIVILLLIQTGGMGFMAVVALFFLAMGRRMGLIQRRLLWQSAGGDDASVRLVARNVIVCTAVCESAGALLLSLRFIPMFGFAKGAFYSVFHAVSAFCNAGFDLLGAQTPFCSLIPFAGDVLVNGTIMLLIVLGGLGFFVLVDLLKSRFCWKRLSLHSKLCLSVSGILILSGALLLYVLEYDASFDGLSQGERLLAALFQSVTTRTAGFATVDLSRASESGAGLMSLLMAIGGSPASTAGGVKTTTFAIFLLGILAEARRKPSVTLFRRRLDAQTVTRAWTICGIYFVCVTVCTLAICAVEPYSMTQVLFEVCSAIGTVGLTMGITPQLTAFSHILLIILMFAGKLGAMTLALALAERVDPVVSSRPAGNVLIG